MSLLQRKFLGYSLLLIALAIGLWLGYKYSGKENHGIVFSNYTMLTNLWESYKKEYLEPGTWRTLDKQQNNITTSEGQSYTMLRAVWMDDKDTFDKSYLWAKDNIQRPKDKLFSWLYGQKNTGDYGVLTERGGFNSASDADTDIALALIFASERWSDKKYLEDAKDILSDIWKHEIITINGTPYLAANNLEKTLDKDYILINPSYLSPYAYRIFARIDSDHPWEKLVGSSYRVIDHSLRSKLDKEKSGHLPPDWVYIHRKTGEITAPRTSELTTNYSYDALRLPWRLALDWKWNQDLRAKEALDKLAILSYKWETAGKLVSSYSHSGDDIHSHEVPAMYGGSIGYFLVSDPGNAVELYNEKLRALYSPDSNDWREKLGYYDSNWAWFGIALYTNQLPNLASTIASQPLSEFTSIIEFN